MYADVYFSVISSWKNEKQNEYPLFIQSLICSFVALLAWVIGTVLGPGDTLVNKRDKNRY